MERYKVYVENIKNSPEIKWRELLNRINESGKAYMTHTKLNDQYVIRFSVGQSTTTLNHLKSTWVLIVRIVEEMEKI